ncbi:unnamed protein product, partial [Mesorhabditis spiculigera]
MPRVFPWLQQNAVSVEGSSASPTTTISASNDEAVQVQFKTLGNRWLMRVLPTDTIGHVKEIVRKYLGRPNAPMMLIYEGKALQKDAEVFGGCGYQEGSAIIVVLMKERDAPPKMHASSANASSTDYRPSRHASHDITEPFQPGATSTPKNPRSRDVQAGPDRTLLDVTIQATQQTSGTETASPQIRKLVINGNPVNVSDNDEGQGSASLLRTTPHEFPPKAPRNQPRQPESFVLVTFCSTNDEFFQMEVQDGFSISAIQTMINDTDPAGHPHGSIRLRLRGKVLNNERQLKEVGYEPDDVIEIVWQDKTIAATNPSTDVGVYVENTQDSGSSFASILQARIPDGFDESERMGFLNGDDLDGTTNTEYLQMTCVQNTMTPTATGRIPEIRRPPSNSSFSTSSSNEMPRDVHGFSWDQTSAASNATAIFSTNLDDTQHSRTSNASMLLMSSGTANDPTYRPTDESGWQTTNSSNFSRWSQRLRSKCCRPSTKVDGMCAKCSTATTVSSKYGAQLCTRCTRDCGRDGRAVAATDGKCDCKGKGRCAPCRYAKWIAVGCRPVAVKSPKPTKKPKK